MPESLLRSYEALIDDVKPGERTVVARINTRAVDRMGTVIEPMGVRMDAYRKNPVVLWEHGLDPVRGRLPVGRNLWIKARKAEGDVLAKTQFRDDDFSRSLFEMYQDGTLRGFSLGGREIPGTFGPPTAAELRARPELAGCRTVYRSVDLAEYSGVAVGGNPEALALAVSRGLWVPDAVRAGLAAAATEGEGEGEDDGDLPPLPAKFDLPPLGGRSAAEHRAARRAGTIAAVRAHARGEAEDLRARLDLRRGVV